MLSLSEWKPISGGGLFCAGKRVLSDRRESTRGELINIATAIGLARQGFPRDITVKRVHRTGGVAMCAMCIEQVVVLERVC